MARALRCCTRKLHRWKLEDGVSGVQASISIRPEGLLASTRDLAALAATCTTFHGPALDALWSTQNSIKPLLSCMPEDLFNSSVSVSRGMPVLRRPMIHIDWARFMSYAARIKKLTVGPDRGLSAFGPLLLSCVPNGLSFPSLKSLVWQRSAMDFQYIRIFFSPALSSIDFVCEASNANVSVLSTLARTCPNLQRLSMSFYPNGRDADAAASSIVLSFHQLQFLNMGPPSSAALEHIGRLSTLTSLHLWTLPERFSRPNSPMFLAFRSLTVDDTAVLSVSRFLGMGFGTPESLDLTFSRFVHAAALGSWTRNFNEVGRQSGGDFPFALTDSLRILFSFPSLASLSLVSPPGYDICDTTVRDMARAWPQLERLELDIFYQYIPHHLTSMDVATSSLFAPTRVARFLSDIFPTLRTIVTDREEADNEDATELEEAPEEIALHHRWKEVEAALPELVAARQEERARARAGEEHLIFYRLISLET
ncbi:hypothetical protein DFH07DRAFT_940015 [Mycena maculata]|uniref:F-box domain-containing protein n=1 Tax=Mycena maculata TaxID=230809 RepID=A0AAD7JB82_9AGAR|nr:hypothetical protein DFH07DRAFT_940015 [Mycena maculata]